jgi:hypothetical protein
VTSVSATHALSDTNNDAQADSCSLSRHPCVWTDESTILVSLNDR